MLYFRLVAIPPHYTASNRTELFLPPFGILFYRFSALFTDIFCLYDFYWITAAKRFNGILWQIKLLGYFYITVSFLPEPLNLRFLVIRHDFSGSFVKVRRYFSPSLLTEKINPLILGKKISLPQKTQ